MTDLIHRISTWMHSNPHGWCTEAKAHALATSILGLRPEIVVEIGVWSGRSLIPMAMALKEVGSGRIIGIDPWSKEASIEGQKDVHLQWWNEVDHEKIYQVFYLQVQLQSLNEFVEIMRKRSDDVTELDMARIGVIDLLHIDGNHSEQAVRDVNKFASKVRNGGLCFMDDVNWHGVGNAVEALQNLGFIRLYNMDTGAMFQRGKV